MSAHDYDRGLEREIFEALALRQKFLEMRDGARALAIDCERIAGRLEGVIVNFQPTGPRRVPSPEETNNG